MAGIASASTLQVVDVLDSGNVADSNGFGAVAYEFRIMKFEFTNAEYARFLNIVDPTGANAQSLWHTNMNNGVGGGISQNLGLGNGSKYVVKTNFADKPVNAVTWYDAARVANWLHNGGSSSSSTETGAYTMAGTGESGGIVSRNAGATFWIPSKDEWYKAAYYNGDSTYWEYATESNSVPSTVTANGTGSGSSGPVGNTANYLSSANWNGSANGNVTSVGTNGGPSHYGTYDMTGNLREIIEGSPVDTQVTLLGGGYGSFATGITATNAGTSGPSTALTSNALTIGFRLATITPEPGSTIPLLTLFGLGMAKSRRRKA